MRAGAVAKGGGSLRGEPLPKTDAAPSLSRRCLRVPLCFPLGVRALGLSLPPANFKPSVRSFLRSLVRPIVRRQVRSPLMPSRPPV